MAATDDWAGVSPESASGEAVVYLPLAAFRSCSTVLLFFRRGPGRACYRSRSSWSIVKRLGSRARRPARARSPRAGLPGTEFEAFRAEYASNS